MEIRDLNKKDFPKLLKEIPDPPKKMRIVGDFPKTEKYLCIVGSRKYSEYGKSVCEKLIEGLRGYPITIVSGLAIGVDSIAHTSAIKNNIKTIAVPGSGLSENVLYPSTNKYLAHKIVDEGGALISEFEDDFIATPWSFPQRNRIMAGMSHATLIIEAELKSGTLITSKYAIDYNRDVFTIPHSIFSKTSEGPHMLLRLGATPITRSSDIITALGLRELEKIYSEKDYSKCSTDEKELIDVIREPMTRDEIIRALGKPVYITQTILATMEIKGLIKEEMGQIRLV
ncbi:MAG: DNA-processing protein DprA [Candidatus Paceibacterota bacterium]